MLSFFKLPLFPLLSILQSWSLKEIILFSMTSNRSFRAMRNLMKYIGYSKQITVEMKVSSTLHSIKVYSASEECSFEIKNNKIRLSEGALSSEQTFKGLKYLHVDDDEFGFQTYWQNDDLALEMIYEHFRNLFERPITSLTYLPNKDSLHTDTDFLKTVLSNQKTIEHCSIGWLFFRLETDATCFQGLFESAQNLNLSWTVLSYDLSKFKFNNVVIEDGEVMPLQKLTELDFESLYLYQLVDTYECLENEQLNSFLRLWVTGFFPRMKNFCLETQASLQLPKILEKMDFELSETHMDVDDPDTRLTGGPLSIRRMTDGKKATVYTLAFWNENGQQMSFFELSVDN